MKVFKIDYDVTTYSPLVPASDATGVGVLDGLPKQSWQVPKLILHNPLRPNPDFWYASRSFAFDAQLPPFNELPLAAIFEDAGELLSVDVEDIGNLVLLNVTTVANAIDRDKTRWQSFDQGRFKYIEDSPGAIVFYADRLPETCIFKIPQNNASQIFCIEWTGDPNREFRAAVERHQLTGLKFQLVWER